MPEADEAEPRHRNNYKVVIERHLLRCKCSLIFGLTNHGSKSSHAQNRSEPAHRMMKN
jgi:hypothetical protein